MTRYHQYHQATSSESGGPEIPKEGGSEDGEEKFEKTEEENHQEESRQEGKEEGNRGEEESEPPGLTSPPLHILLKDHPEEKEGEEVLPQETKPKRKPKVKKEKKSGKSGGGGVKKSSASGGSTVKKSSGKKRSELKAQVYTCLADLSVATATLLTALQQDG